MFSLKKIYQPPLAVNAATALIHNVLTPAATLLVLFLNCFGLPDPHVGLAHSAAQGHFVVQLTRVCSS